MNVDKFTGRADVYQSFRPSYPDELIDWLYTQAGFTPESVIADIGAGTGIFSKLLLGMGSRVVCVEPNGDMRNTAMRELTGFQRCRFVSAPAENTTLDEISVNFVTAAQAFHWFDRKKFKLECRRILQPGGRVVLLWNNRGRPSEVDIGTAKINEKYSPNNKGPSGAAAFPPDYFSDFFRDGQFDYREFENDFTVDEEIFIGRALSSSYAPRKDSPNHEAYVGELRGLFSAHAQGGIIKIANETKLYTGAV